MDIPQSGLPAKEPVARAHGHAELLQKLVHLPEAAFPKQVLRTTSWKGPIGTVSGAAQPAGSRKPLGSRCLTTGLIPEQNR